MPNRLANSCSYGQRDRCCQLRGRWSKPFFWHFPVCGQGKSVLRGDKVIESDFYAVKFQHGGPRKTIGLYTANLWEAAEKAKEMYFFLTANGWDALLGKYRTDKEQSKYQPEKIGKAKPVKKTGHSRSVITSNWFELKRN
jgi:hypothetical protein